MAAPPPPPMHFGIPKEVIEVGYHLLIHPHSEGLEYVMIKSTIWVDVGEPKRVPHRYRSWYHHYHDERREEPVPEFDVPRYVLEVALGKGTADLRGGSVIDAKDPKLGDDPDSSGQSIVDSS
ncbi:hypothetical protein ACJRO7_015259 [Eucalyptus globulus]|uniref:Uncharacterized protein n=1 Tax=Eucalyptus globulus TaxID=34317 RepID=A0ABD3L2Z5_EUCGL